MQDANVHVDSQIESNDKLRWEARFAFGPLSPRSAATGTVTKERETESKPTMVCD